MSNAVHHEPHRPLIDPEQLEEAGRAFRQWLDRVLGRAEPTRETEIAWEDGESRDDRRGGYPPEH